MVFSRSSSFFVAGVLGEGTCAFVPDDTSNTYAVPDTLASLGLVSPNLHILPYDSTTEYVSVWMRDTGPFNVYEQEVDALHTVGWQVNHDASFVAEALGLPCVELAEGSSHFLDGGNYLTDGHGTLLCDDWHSTSIPYQQTFQDVFGIDTFVDLPGYRAHIDYYMKLINEEVLLVSEIPFSNYIGIEPAYDDSLHLEQAIAAVQQQAVSCYGRPYEIVRIRNAPTYDNTPLNLTYLTSDASYTNSLILNHTVMVPTYEHAATDTVALRIYQQHMPGYEIVGVPCVYFAAMGSTVHCVTKEIGADEPVFVSHAWLPDSVAQTTYYPVDATIRTRTDIESATVYWSLDPGTGFEPLAMAPAGDDRYLASIPGQPWGTRVFYYIEASSMSGRTVQRPLVAPAGTWSFLVDPDGVTVGVDAYDPPLAAAIHLTPGHPNPFRQTTSLGVSIPAAARAVVRVYDVTGRLVVELHDGTLPAGSRRAVSWDGRDLDGRRVASGTYFIRLEAGDRYLTEKVQLLR